VDFEIGGREVERQHENSHAGAEIAAVSRDDHLADIERWKRGMSVGFGRGEPANPGSGGEHCGGGEKKPGDQLREGRIRGVQEKQTSGDGTSDAGAGHPTRKDNRMWRMVSR
jgi:hypothetical protein